MDSFCKNIEIYVKSLNIKMKVDNKSKNTVMAYNRTYKYFIKFSKGYHKKITFKGLKENDIYAFIEYKSENMLEKENISISTTNSIITHLKVLFKHIEKNSDELYDFDKVFDDIKLKQQKSVPKGLTFKEVEKLKVYLKELKNDDTFLNYRNATLMKLMLFGGLRASEALSIRLSDITLYQDSELYRISFRGKGDKIRTSFIPVTLIEDELQTLAEQFALSSSSPIAITSTGANMDRFQLSKMANGIYKRAGIKSQGLHILRHTAAKVFLDSGVSIVVVQSLLGHSSIQTTSMYANPTESIITQELNKTIDKS